MPRFLLIAINGPTGAEGAEAAYTPGMMRSMPPT